MAKTERRHSTVSASSGRTVANDGGPCPRCHGSGYIVTGDRTAAICICVDLRHLAGLLMASRITPAFQGKRFEDFQLDGLPESVRTMCGCARDYADCFETIRPTERNWLVLLGQPGCGKTHLAMAAANQLMASAVPALYFPHAEGMGELKEIYRAGEGRLNQKLQAIKDAQLLVWDDLWKSTRPFDLEIAFEVLNYRYLNLLPTIISSELVPERLIAVDQAVGSRIIERGRAHLAIVEDPQANYRLR